MCVFIVTLLWLKPIDLSWLGCFVWVCVCLSMFWYIMLVMVIDKLWIDCSKSLKLYIIDCSKRLSH